MCHERITRTTVTYFICFTIVLFPDSPAPERDGQQLHERDTVTLSLWMTAAKTQNKTKKHLDVTPHRPLSRWVQIKPDFNARLKLIWSHLITLRTVCSSFVSKHLERSSLVMNFYWQISTCYLSDQSAVWMHKFTDSASRTRRLIFDCRKTHDIWRDLHILNAFLRQPVF